MPVRKTLLLTEIFPPTVGGSGRLFWELYSRQPADDFAVACADVPGAAEFDAASPLPIHRLPMRIGDRGLRRVSSLKFYLGTARRVRRLMRDGGFTALHCGRNLPEGFVGYLLNKLHGIPYHFYAHGEDVGVSRRSREMAWMTRRVMARAAGALANSRNTRRMLVEEWGYPADRIRVIQPGVDAAAYVPAPPDENARRDLGWLGRTVVLTVGRLQAQKGHDRMIRALGAVRRRVPDVLYAIVGTGPEEAALRALAVAEGHADAVRFHGGLPDAAVRACYQQCDLFALPNRSIGGDVEGFGMVLLEAQACGKAALAGASGGTAEAVDAPRTGRVVDCETPAPLADAVIELLSDRAELAAMGRRGRAWVEADFDWPARAAHAAEAWAE